jgi:cysteinyl-tRNA synthetase
MDLVCESSEDRTAGCTNWDVKEKYLLKKLYDVQQDVHCAFCDNLDTPKALSSILILITESNIYLAERNKEKLPASSGLLQKIAGYITYILRVNLSKFGLISI